MIKILLMVDKNTTRQCKKHKFKMVINQLKIMFFYISPANEIGIEILFNI